MRGVASPGESSVKARPAPSGLLDRLQVLALRLDPRRVVVANGVVIALLGLLGILYLAAGSPFAVFELDGERNAPATYSAFVWTCLSILALLVGRAEQRPAAARVWQALSLPLLLVAADEFGEIHERLERITGIDWQILYSPLALVAAVLWILVGRRLRELQAGFGLFAAGTVCGFVSQVVEAVEYGANDQEISGFDELVVFEELLEMVAVVLIGLALLAALRAVTRRPRT
jgi:hypothetical protein